MIPKLIEFKDGRCCDTCKNRQHGMDKNPCKDCGRGKFDMYDEDEFEILRLREISK